MGLYHYTFINTNNAVS